MPQPRNTTKKPAAKKPAASGQAKPAGPEAAALIQQATNLAEATPLLRRPFTPEAIKFKIEVNPRKVGENQWKKALVVTYIDARLAAERLNAVCPGEWEDEYGDLFRVNAEGDAGIRCTVRVFDRSRSDVGFASGDREKKGLDHKGIKGLYSDSFKRACVKFGIGAFLYSMPKLYLEARTLSSWTRGDKTYWDIGPEAERELKQRYQAWLNLQSTIDRFGTALDHGDVEDSQGDVEAFEPAVSAVPDDTAPPAEPSPEPAAPAEPAPAAPPAADRDEAIRQLRIAYAESGCTQQVWNDKCTELGITDLNTAPIAKLGELHAWLTS